MQKEGRNMKKVPTFEVKKKKYNEEEEAFIRYGLPHEIVKSAPVLPKINNL